MASIKPVAAVREINGFARMGPVFLCGIETDPSVNVVSPNVKTPPRQYSTFQTWSLESCQRSRTAKRSCPPQIRPPLRRWSRPGRLRRRQLPHRHRPPHRHKLGAPGLGTGAPPVVEGVACHPDTGQPVDCQVLLAWKLEDRAESAKGTGFNRGVCGSRAILT